MKERVEEKLSERELEKIEVMEEAKKHNPLYFRLLYVYEAGDAELAQYTSRDYSVCENEPWAKGFVVVYGRSSEW